METPSSLVNQGGAAWIWVRQLADSMIIMAAALTVIGVDLRPYFAAKGLGTDSQYSATINAVEQENTELKLSNVDLENRISAIKVRLMRLETVSHDPAPASTGWKK
jgi:hypothetical protein